MTDAVITRFYPILKMAHDMKIEDGILEAYSQELNEIEQIRRTVLEVSSDPPTFFTTT